jgi:hypothetical protein
VDGVDVTAESEAGAVAFAAAALHFKSGLGRSLGFLLRLGMFYFSFHSVYGRFWSFLPFMERFGRFWSFLPFSFRFSFFSNIKTQSMVPKRQKVASKLKLGEDNKQILHSRLSGCQNGRRQQASNKRSKQARAVLNTKAGHLPDMPYYFSHTSHFHPDHACALHARSLLLCPFRGQRYPVGTDHAPTRCMLCTDTPDD